MDIIYGNLPESKDEINLIIESTLLNNNPEIIYNNNEENTENKNQIIINQKKYKFSCIFKDLEKEKLPELITKEINTKNNLTLLLMLNNSKEEDNYNSEIRGVIKNMFNKENLEKLNIKNIIYNYYQINLTENKSDNIIKDKILNDENNYVIDIQSDENNTDISLLKIKIDYSDLNISSFIQILFIYNSFDKIVPLYAAINQEENDYFLLKEKLNDFLLLEKEIKEKINKLPEINTDFLENARIYEKEVMNYYDNFIKNVENLEKKEKTANKGNKNKNSINDSIKEAKNLLNDINKEQFKQREKDIYEKYIQTYSNINKQNSENNSNSYNIEELKMTINKFNNLNEELIEKLEAEKKEDKNKKESTDKNKNKQIDELKNIINQLEKELKEEKTKNTESRNKHDKNIKIRSMSEAKLGPKKEDKSNSSSNNTIRLEEENRNLKKKIEELNETISKLKNKNDNLFKTNEKLLKEKNNLRNELLKEKNTNSSIVDNKSIDKSINTELYNSPHKSIINQKYNTTAKTKKFNKNKTSLEPLFTGHNLLLLKKIQDENKALAKQIKDFNSKNFQLELSIKGINNGETSSNIKSPTNDNSILSTFTNNTRKELKNIEKKYKLDKK